MPASLSVAIFAHNEERNLVATISSIRAAGEGTCFEIVVLANGCTDQTVAIARNYASRHTHIQVIEIEFADKANAWNRYVHEVSITPPYCDAALHLFVDGDILVNPGSFDAFLAAHEQCPSINAVGALPTSGRDKVAWRQRMIANGTLSGGLYALSGDFLQRIRQREVFIPCGFIGEDWMVSLYAQSDLNPLNAVLGSNTNVVFALDAGFSFRSLSLWRPKDYRTYIRRLWRYAMRGVQYEMLVGLLQHCYPEELPKDVDGLYLRGTPPSRLKWVGTSSILRFIAVQRVQLLRKRHIRTSG